MNAQVIFIPEEPEARGAIVERLRQFLLTATPGKRLRVTVDAFRLRRSHEQNRYLWGVVYPTIMQAQSLQGWSAEDLHEFFLGEVYGWETLEGFGRKRLRPVRRSSTMSTTEFAGFVMHIQQRMAELGVYIPDPHEGDSP